MSERERVSKRSKHSSERNQTKRLHAAARLTQEGSSAAYEAEKAAFRGESSAFTAKSREEGGVGADLHLWLHPQKAGMFVFLFVSHEVKEQRRIPHVQQNLPSSTGKEGPRHKLGHIWALTSLNSGASF